MSKKIKVTPQLIQKAKDVFEKAKKSSIKANEGLTRAELRALERKGIVEKIPIFGQRKFTDSSPSMSYIWSLKNA